MRLKLQRFWREPFFNKLNRLSNGYYLLKAIVVYRFSFRSFGRLSYIRKPTLISNPQFITVGDRVTIRDGVRLEAIQSAKNRIPDLRIGHNTNIEQNVHIVCHSKVHIGSNVSVTGNCAIVDVTHPHSQTASPIKIGGRIQDEDSYVEIGDWSFIGFGSVILPNVRIGRNVVIGSNSVVIDDIADYSVAAGAPAKVIKRFDSEKNEWLNASSSVSVRTKN